MCINYEYVNENRLYPKYISDWQLEMEAVGDLPPSRPASSCSSSASSSFQPAVASASATSNKYYQQHYQRQFQALQQHADSRIPRRFNSLMQARTVRVWFFLLYCT